MKRANPLKVFREKQTPPLSQAGLARLLGVSRAYLYRLESGERQPGRKLLPTISKKTGISPAKMRPDLAAALERAS